MRWFRFVLIAVLVAAVGFWLWQQRAERDRRAAFAEVMAYGARMEADLRHAEAVLAYETGLDLDLTGAERAELRYQLARARITANDLNGALGVLQDLTTEDVARFQIDVGPLYLRLGEKAQQAGRYTLARIAFREGGGAAPPRYEEFARRLEDLSRIQHQELERDDAGEPKQDR